MMLDVRLRRLGVCTWVGLADSPVARSSRGRASRRAIEISPWLIGGAVVASILYYGFALTVAIQSRDRIVNTQQGLIGLVGEARGKLAPEGPVYVKGAMWRGTNRRRRDPARHEGADPRRRRPGAQGRGRAAGSRRRVRAGRRLTVDPGPRSWRSRHRASASSRERIPEAVAFEQPDRHAERPRHRVATPRRLPRRGLHLLLRPELLRAPRGEERPRGRRQVDLRPLPRARRVPRVRLGHAGQPRHLGRHERDGTPPILRASAPAKPSELQATSRVAARSVLVRGCSP